MLTFPSFSLSLDFVNHEGLWVKALMIDYVILLIVIVIASFIFPEIAKMYLIMPESLHL